MVLRNVSMWDHPYVDCVSQTFLVQELFLLYTDARRVFPQSVLDIIPLIGGVISAVVSSACFGCCIGPPFCFMAVITLLGAGSAPQLSE